MSKRRRYFCLVASVMAGVMVVGMSIYGEMMDTVGAMAEIEMPPRNVVGTPLQQCCTSPITGFYRDGYCRTGREDIGTHVVAATVTEEFLRFTLARGNDLITPRPEFQFPGLKPGDGWCLCALRWLEAYSAGVAPPVRLQATHEKALEYMPLDILRAHAEARSGDE